MKIDIDELKKDNEMNFKERMKFVEYWTNYVRTHSDKEWSEQQNVLINSQLKNALQDKKRLI